MDKAARDSGIDVIGHVPGGTHFSLFYQTKQDLIDVLVPYFKAGLKNNEFCMWVTAESLNAGEVKAYMAEAMPDFDAYFEKGQIEIIPYTEWYKINGAFDPERVLVGWIEKLRKAEELGFRGLRATGDVSWVETGGWKDFLDYEQTVNDVIGRHEMIALCTYPLDGCVANDILDVVSAHQFALTRRNGVWKVIEDQGQKKARKALRESEEVLWHIFGSSPVPMVLYNESKGSYYYNNKFTETFGYTIEDIPRIDEWWVLAYPDENYREFVKKRWYAAVDDAVKKRTSIEPQEVVVACKDGSKKRILCYFSSIGVLNLVVFYDITELKRAEEALGFERLQLLSIFDSIDDVVYVSDPYTYEVLYANKAMKEKFGGDLVGGVCYREFQRKDSPCDFCTNSIILEETGKPYRWEYYNPTVGRYFMITDRIIKWPDGRDVRFEIAKDITERRNAEEALRESENKFRVLAETSPAAIFLYQGEKYLYVNPMAETLTGYSSDELLTGDAWGWIQADFRDLVKERAIRRQQGELLPTRYEVKYCSKDGREGWVDFTAGLIEYGGKPAGLAMAFDVSGRKRAEEALSAGEQFLNNVFDSIQDGISVLDKDLNIIRVNHVMEEWHPYMKPLIGKKCYFAYHEQQSPCGVCPSLRAIGLKTAQSDIVPFHGEDGKLRGWLEIFAFPLKDGEGNVTGVIEHVRDITERKKAEVALEEAKEQAELYLDLMGHDINNMHQIALGYLEIARDMHQEAGEGEFLDKSIEVLQRSALLIKNVRKLQKLTDGVLQLERVDVCKVLLDVQMEFGSVPHKAITLNLNGCEHCLVRANDLLRDVFVNLVGNAVKHTGERADILVDLDVVWNDGRQYCRVTVEDNGPGIPDDFKGVIFKRALKGTARVKGIGLGLYIVKSLLESYGGWVWVQDRVPGDHTKGAMFVVLLPAADN